MIIGRKDNITSGLHYSESVVEYFKTGRLKVRVDGGSEIKSVDELISMIDQGVGLNYKDSLGSGVWSNTKTVFKTNKSMSDIADFADWALDNPSAVSIESQHSNGNIDIGEILVDGQTIRIYFDSTGSNVISWFPIY